MFESITSFVTNDPALSAKLEVLQRVEALFKAIEALTTDVNDH